MIYTPNRLNTTTKGGDSIRKKGGFMITKNDELKAVYSTDLDQFLLTLGIKEQFESSSIHCVYCDSIISKEGKER